MTNPPAKSASFDAYAAQYDKALGRGLVVTGEDKVYFACGRVGWLAGCLQRLGVQPRQVLDFGCGTGTATPFLLELIGVERVVGVDISAQSVELARQSHGGPKIEFHDFRDYRSCGEVDLAFCNGVFHHIPISERGAAVEYVYRSLKPGGLFALWENNPWNPGTRWVMSRIPFDRDAVTLAPPVARQMVCQGGFEVLATSYQFIFPRLLRCLRGLEAPLARWPLGAQYQVLCRRPMTSTG